MHALTFSVRGRTLMMGTNAMKPIGSCLIQVNDECKPNRELLGGDDRTNQRKFDKADWWASRIVAAGAGNHSLPR